MTEPEIYAALTTIFHEAFGDDSIVLRAEMAADDIPGWDSIKMVAIIISVEQHFGVRLRSREIDQLKCVGDLAGLVGSKVAA